ncbi:hypothetical protein D9M71_559230 [compost metagenome]
MRVVMKLRVIPQRGEKPTTIIDDGHAHKVQFWIKLAGQPNGSVATPLSTGVSKRVFQQLLERILQGAPVGVKLIPSGVLVDWSVGIRLRQPSRDSPSEARCSSLCLMVLADFGDFHQRGASIVSSSYPR